MVQKKGTGLMMVFVDIDPEYDADFNAWYNEEHVDDLLRLPGFLNAARYEALRGGPRYLACYELESVEAVQSEDYLNFHRNPSEWTQRISLSTKGRNYARIVCAQVYPKESDSQPRYGPGHPGRAHGGSSGDRGQVQRVLRHRKDAS